MQKDLCMTFIVARFHPRNAMLPVVSRRAITSPRSLLRLASTSTRPNDVSWPEYLRLRQTQRRAGIIASIPTTALGAVIGGSYFGTIEVWPGYQLQGTSVSSVHVFTGGSFSSHIRHRASVHLCKSSTCSVHFGELMSTVLGSSDFCNDRFRMATGQSARHICLEVDASLESYSVGSKREGILSAY